MKHFLPGASRFMTANKIHIQQQRGCFPAGDNRAMWNNSEPCWWWETIIARKVWWVGGGAEAQRDLGEDWSEGQLLPRLEIQPLGIEGSDA